MAMEKNGAISSATPNCGSSCGCAKAASDTLAKAHFIQLAQVDQAQFAKSLMAPSKPKAALKRAFENRRKLLDLA